MASEENIQPADATCGLCGQTVSRRGLTQHLKNCRDKHPSEASVPAERILHIFVDGQWTKDYYLHLEAPATLTFGELDAFLREIWLECCGHLSGFRLKGRAAGMAGQLGGRLSTGVEFEHDYDYGTTTTLAMKVIDDSERVRRGDGVFVLARNNDPGLVCQECGEHPAEWICGDCLWDGWGLLCGACAPEHECGEEMLLPVVNSPRMGMCGYSGPATWENTPVGAKPAPSARKRKRR